MPEMIMAMTGNNFGQSTIRKVDGEKPVPLLANSASNA